MLDKMDENKEDIERYLDLVSADLNKLIRDHAVTETKLKTLLSVIDDPTRHRYHVKMKQKGIPQ